MDGLQTLRDLDLPFARHLGLDYVSADKERWDAIRQVLRALPKDFLK